MAVLEVGNPGGLIIGRKILVGVYNYFVGLYLIFDVRS
jgi:hypothetical protein